MRATVEHAAWAGAATDRCAASIGTQRRQSVGTVGWDASLVELGGQLHQSAKWGIFKEMYGWQVEQIMTHSEAGTAMAQVLFKHMGPVSTAFLPRGPLMEGDQAKVMPEIMSAVHAACRRHRALKVNIEPEHPVALPAGFRIAEQRHSPGRTVMVPLVDDEQLLAQMHASKRREVRRAIRRGITVEHREPSVEATTAFFELLADTAHRNRFAINSRQYYRDFLNVFGPDAALMFAVIDGVVAAGLIVATFGTTATYVFGGSSTRHREPGATAYLQYEAMRWAREHGCARYDLWGIPYTDPSTTGVPEQGPIQRELFADAGLYRFKVELGGESVTYPPAIECLYHPVLIWGQQRLKSALRSIPR